MKPNRKHANKSMRRKDDPPRTIDFGSALKIMQVWVDVLTDGRCAICEVIDKPYGWVFSYTDKRHLEDGAEPFIAPYAPVIFNRIKGDIIETGTGFELDHYLRDYESKMLAAWLELTPQSSNFSRSP